MVEKESSTATVEKKSSEDDIPSGSCNFSRIENSNLVIKFDKTNMIGGIPNGKILIYAINYNILQITQGMAGLLYSN